ncbi:protein-methionine-sulfoxide reductase catalytic subunit MsrP [Oryzomicrobium sp.]|uniref:protein-methionine-sulfoxide reductase catalytic subunit MsrP n=1 Tax=Oryzomicrobium sp. TaxID=1911578 RepID=UPI002FDF6BA2
MPLLIRRPSDIRPSEITSPEHFSRRRELIAALGLGLGAAGLALPRHALAAPAPAGVSPPTGFPPVARAAPGSPWFSDESQTPKSAITSYGNFYEYGVDKAAPGKYAPGLLKTRPWTVAVEGEVLKPRTFAIDDLLKLAPLEERIYRLRCVEGWSMVVPWVGYSLSALINKVEPTGNAKFIEFVTLADPAQMPGVRSPLLDWPYVEGLRLDEARHPLTLLGLGLYGEALPAQNGAPVRIVVPWKYGFKSAKSIVKIRFLREQPTSTWTRAAPSEYGFYSNVNPAVDHPRWSQKTERRLGEWRRRPTLPFNGYADQVAGLYAGMDLKKNF